MDSGQIEGVTRHRSWQGTTLVYAIGFVWGCIRLPALALMVVMEPVVCGVLSAISTVTLLVALFFGLIVKPPHFPMWGMLAFSLGSAGLLVPYYALTRLFSSSARR